MPIRFETREGALFVVQSFDSPTIYLDHWALRTFADNDGDRLRLLNLIKTRGGTLVVSHANLAELAGPEDPRHIEAAAAFLENVLPNIYFALFDIQKAIDQERRPRDVAQRLPAPADVELLLAVAERRPDDLQPFTIATLVNLIGSRRHKLRNPWQQSNLKLANHINRVRQDVKARKDAAGFKAHAVHIPTLAVLQELFRPLFLDANLSFDANDAGDAHHAVISIAHCDFCLLDGKWEDMHRRMVRRVKQLNLPIRVARVYSARNFGVKRFLQDLEDYEPHAP